MMLLELHRVVLLRLRRQLTVSVGISGADASLVAMACKQVAALACEQLRDDDGGAALHDDQAEALLETIESVGASLDGLLLRAEGAYSLAPGASASAAAAAPRRRR